MSHSKVLLSMLTVSLLATSAEAQQIRPEEKIKFELSGAEIQVIGEALNDLPFKKSAPVINSIDRQIIEYFKSKEKKEEGAGGAGGTAGGPAPK